MRISSSQMYGQITGSLLKQEAAYARVVEQLSTGRRLLSPADDPLAASQAIGVAHNDAVNTAFANNRETASRNLNLQEAALGHSVTTMQSVLTRLVQVGNGTLSDADRLTLGSELTAMRDALVGLGNSTDGNGQYLFSGYDSSNAPFGAQGQYQIVRDGNAATQMQVSEARVMTTGDLGSDVFRRANPGSTGFIVSADIQSGSTATFGTVHQSNTAAQPASRQVRFVQQDGQLHYAVTVQGRTTAPQVYVPGEPLALGDGMELTIQGEPQTGDTFSVARASEPGVVDLFGALNGLIDTLARDQGTDPSAHAELANVLATTTQIVKNSYDNVLTVRASVGARLQELDSLDAVGTVKQLSNAKALSGLEDADVIATYSEALQRQTALNAAAMAFQAIQGLNLFSQK